MRHVITEDALFKSLSRNPFGFFSSCTYDFFLHDGIEMDQIFTL